MYIQTNNKVYLKEHTPQLNTKENTDNIHETKIRITFHSKICYTKTIAMSTKTAYSHDSQKEEQNEKSRPSCRNVIQKNARTILQRKRSQRFALICCLSQSGMLPVALVSSRKKRNPQPYVDQDHYARYRDNSLYELRYAREWFKFKKLTRAR